MSFPAWSVAKFFHSRDENLEASIKLKAISYLTAAGKFDKAFLDWVCCRVCWIWGITWLILNGI
jgi:hypothetical protein